MSLIKINPNQITINRGVSPTIMSGVYSAMPGQITNPSFFIGGNALFTVYGPKEHFTYKINLTPKFDGTGKELYLCFLQVGFDYKYMGVYNPKHGKVYSGNKSKIGDREKSFLALNWALSLLFGHKAFPAGYGVVHQNACCVCSGFLIESESQKTGKCKNCR